MDPKVLPPKVGAALLDAVPKDDPKAGGLLVAVEVPKPKEGAELAGAENPPNEGAAELAGAPKAGAVDPKVGAALLVVAPKLKAPPAGLAAPKDVFVLVPKPPVEAPNPVLAWPNISISCV